MTPRRFPPPPWSVLDIGGSFAVKANGRIADPNQDVVYGLGYLSLENITFPISLLVRADGVVELAHLRLLQLLTSAFGTKRTFHD